VKQKIVIQDFISLDTRLDMDIFLKNMIKDVTIWFHGFGEIIPMLSLLILKKDVLIIQVR
jgi:hypothetical protein